MTFVPARDAQSTPARRPLQATRAVLLVLLGAVGPLRISAQTVTITRDGEPFYTEVRGSRLGRFAAGVAFPQIGSRPGFTQVTLDGWIIRSATASAHRDGHTLSVTREENLREVPNGRLLARFVGGALVDSLDQRGGWVRVRRSVWVATESVRGAVARATPPPAAAADTTGQSADARRAVVRRRLNLYPAPDSSAIGTLEAGVPVRVTTRAGGWVRVETQAWVRESDIRLSDNAILTGVSAAELRGAPDQFRGRLLRWSVQYLALRTADELRPDFEPGQRYMLARGPAPEYAFVYIIVPDDKIADVQKLAPLASVDVVARVVNGRSAYLANPILELVELP